MSDNYPARLFGHIKDQEERKEFRQTYASIRNITDQTLRRLVEQSIADSLRKTEDVESYEKLRWAEFQADQLGYRRALRELLSLLP